MTGFAAKQFPDVWKLLVPKPELGNEKASNHSAAVDGLKDATMNTFDVILHPTDFSTDSDQAFQLACGIARDQLAELVVVHVLAPSDCPDCDSDADLLNEDRPAVRDCREQFQRMRSLAGDIPLSFRIALGYAVGTILNVARREQADLIVIASHQHTQFHLQLHGSIAEGVLRQAHCPVLCLRQPTLHPAVTSTPATVRAPQSGCVR